MSEKWITRRGAVAMGLAAGACATAEGTLPAPAASLNALAAAKGMRFGAAVGAGGNSNEFGDPRFMALVERECGVMVSENEHKWPFLHPEPGRFTFETADQMVGWAEARNIAYRGHCVVWHHTRWLPRYINEYDFGSQPRAEAERVLREHITTVMQHYPRIASWDVINETVDQITGELRETSFTRAAGYEINDFIYHVAREAAPNAQLVYNDYMSWEAGSAAHRTGVLRALETWLGRGVPIQALGIQAHLANIASSTEFNTAQEREWRAFLDEVTGMGLDLLITEFDVNDNKLPADIAARDAEVAAYAKAYLDITLSYREMGDVLCWGLTDNYTWLAGFSPRPDGIAKRPLPFDENYQPKPLYHAIAEAFRGAPQR